MGLTMIIFILVFYLYEHLLNASSGGEPSVPYVLCTPYNHAPLHSVTLFKATYVGCTWAREGVTVDPEEENSPAAPAGTRTETFRSRVRLCTTELSTVSDSAVKGQSQAAFLKSQAAFFN